MKIDEQITQLWKQINEEMAHRGQEAWFFGPIPFPAGDKRWHEKSHPDIRGFLGTKDIIFVGLNPSRSNLSTRPRASESLSLFYDQLEENEFSNAHLTDLIKIRMRGEQKKDLFNAPPFPRFWDYQWRYLRHEVGLLRPRLIVSMGNECDERLCRHCLYKAARREIRVEKIPHYASWAYAKAKGKKKAKDWNVNFAKRIKEVRFIYDEILPSPS